MNTRPNIGHYLIAMSTSCALMTIAMEPEKPKPTEYDLAIHFLKNTQPKDIPDLILDRFPQHIRKTMFEKFIPDYSLCKRIVELAEINNDCLLLMSRCIEAEARDHERKFVLNTILKTPSNICPMHPIIGRVDIRSWSPDGRPQGHRVDGKDIVIPFKEPNPFEAAINWVKYDVFPGQAFIFDRIKADAEDNFENIHLIRQTITKITLPGICMEEVHFPSKPYEVITDLDFPTPTELEIKTRMCDGQPIVSTKIYHLQEPQMSSSFEEALAHTIAYTIQKENARIHAQTHTEYKKYATFAAFMGPKLCSFSTLSYADNQSLHGLLAGRDFIDFNEDATAETKKIVLTSQEEILLVKMSKDMRRVVRRCGFRTEKEMQDWLAWKERQKIREAEEKAEEEIAYQRFLAHDRARVEAEQRTDFIKQITFSDACIIS